MHSETEIVTGGVESMNAMSAIDEVEVEAEAAVGEGGKCEITTVT